ncbi:MAG: oligoendopeptidase F [Bacillota bacterium]|nr:MAG: oligoendopeptidase F [Bacillota bacterium]
MRRREAVPLKRVPKREEIPEQYRWDLERIFPSDEAWEQEYQAVEGLIPRLQEYQGTLAQSGARLLECLRLRDEIGQRVETLYAYASMRKDEDNTVARYQALHDRAVGLYSRATAAMAFIRPEILAIPDDRLELFLAEEPGLAIYRFHLEDIRREREHVRSPEVEALLAQAAEIAQSPAIIFSMLDNADMKFPTVRDEEGNEVELTKGRYLRLMESQDRRVRRDAFMALYGTYRKYVNTLAASLAASVKKDVFYARARNYRSSLEAALFRDNIPVSVYHNLIATVRKNLPALHRYMAVRKRLLGVDELHMYDIYVPLVKGVDRKIPYEEAAETVAAALAPLGEEYVSALREGLRSRWIDVYETAGKTSGAYSGGAYTTAPYILLNYQENVDSMYTLAHELGHSMHSYFTRRTQPYVYGDYTIFVAEVASTLNEALLTEYLLQHTDDPQLRRYIVNHQVETIRTTLFRQTMFAEFELAIHERVERGEALTAESLCALYKELNVAYHGPEMVVDEEIALEWARIPHFYRAFYVYQYATGISAAMALARQILSEGRPAVERYLEFLRSGSSDYSIDLLRRAGVDMTSPEPVQAAIDHFSRLVEELAASAT